MAALLSCSVWAQSLRDYVCVVRGNLSSENKTFLADLKDSLLRNGYTYYSNYIAAFLEGTFGSGFIWYAPDGNPYIVTNRHVAGNYETVNLSFENEDGSVSEFKEMKVVFSDDDVDIALISLPASFKKPGLQLSSARISDGDDVYSAGFPGLGGNPSWQFGKGIVSNSSAKIKELIDPEISSVIQHTAQIDGGNSGGPLLVKDSSSKAGYKVCGINTWSAITRQNTNFSIPAATLEKTVKSKFIQKNAVSFDERSVSFIKASASNDDFTLLVPYISNAMVSSFGEKALKDVLSKAPSSVRSYVSDVFESNPLIGLRCALSYSVWSKIHSDTERVDVKEVSDEATGKKVVFARGESTFESFWIEEQGNWKLSDFEGLKKETKTANKDKARNQNGSAFSIEDPYWFSISGGYNKKMDYNEGGFMLDFQYRFNFLAFGMSVMTDTVMVPEKQSDYWAATDKSELKKQSVFNIAPMVSLRVPFKFNNLVIMPLVEARAGITFPKDFFDSNMKPFHSGYGAGLELAWCGESGLSPFVGAKYLQLNYTTTEPNATMKEENLVIYVGVKVLER